MKIQRIFLKHPIVRCWNVLCMTFWCTVLCCVVLCSVKSQVAPCACMIQVAASSSSIVTLTDKVHNYLPVDTCGTSSVMSGILMNLWISIIDLFDLVWRRLSSYQIRWGRLSAPSWIFEMASTGDGQQDPTRLWRSLAPTSTTSFASSWKEGRMQFPGWAKVQSTTLYNAIVGWESRSVAV